jgi:hypothetical protein
MGAYLCANMSDREVLEPCVHANVAVEEVLEPGVRGVVAVGGVLEPCRSTAVGTLLTSPCFRRGLRTAVVMDARGGAIITCYRDKLARGRVMMHPPWRGWSKPKVGRGGDSS